jgi:hypothetical protein
MDDAWAKQGLFIPFSANYRCKMAFMFVSCQTSPEATPEANKPGEPLGVPGSFNLNGKWKVTVEWKNEDRSGTSNLQYEIVLKGKESKMIDIRSGNEFFGTLIWYCCVCRGGAARKYYARAIELMPSQSPFWVSPVIKWGFLVYGFSILTNFVSFETTRSWNIVLNVQ